MALNNVYLFAEKCSLFYSRPIKSYWHGAGHTWGVSEPSSVSPPGTCDQWRTDSPLAVGLGTKMGDPSLQVLAPHRFLLEMKTQFWERKIVFQKQS